MLIELEDIQKIRSVASNIDRNKVNVYIEEAERLDLIPIIGMSLYDRIAKGDDKIVISVDRFGRPHFLADQEGNEIVVAEQKTTAETLLLNGGTYFDTCDKLQYMEGIKVALAYLAYSRLLRNHQIAVTPFGVVSKMGDDSNPTDARTVASVLNETRSIGLAILDRCVRYWLQVEECYAVNILYKVFRGNGKRRFVVIGD